MTCARKCELNRTKYAFPACTSQQLWHYTLVQLQFLSVSTVSPKPSNRALEGNRNSDPCDRASLSLMLL